MLLINSIIDNIVQVGIHNGDVTADNPCYRYGLWVAISCKFQFVLFELLLTASFIISLSENHDSMCCTLSPGVAPIIFLVLLLQPMSKHKNTSSLNISISTILYEPTLISLATEPVSKGKWNLWWGLPIHKNVRNDVTIVNPYLYYIIYDTIDASPV